MTPTNNRQQINWFKMASKHPCEVPRIARDTINDAGKLIGVQLLTSFPNVHRIEINNETAQQIKTFPAVNVAEGVVTKETDIGTSLCFVRWNRPVFFFFWFRAVNCATTPASWTYYVKIIHYRAACTCVCLYKGAIAECIT